MPDINYSVDEVAEILEVSPRTVRNLTSRGRLPGSYKLDPLKEKSSFRIPKSDLENYIRMQKSS